MTMTAYLPSQLNPYAERLLGKTQTVLVKGTRTYPDGRELPFAHEEKELVATVEVLESHGGPEDSWYIHRYTLPSGRVYTEYVQEWIWSDYSSRSIPVMALKTQRVFLGKVRERVVLRSLWSRRQLAKLTG